MEFAEAVRRRRSIRRFDPDRAVDPEVLERVLDAGLRVPSAGYTQAVTLLVLDTAEQVGTYWRVTAGEPSDRDDGWLRGMRTAPVLILVWTSEQAYLDRYAEPDKGWTDRDPGRWTAPYWYVDAGMAAMNALLAIVDEDLGGCFFGVPVERLGALHDHLGVPEDQQLAGVIALGHPAPEGPGGGTRGSPARRARVPKDVRIRRGNWTH